MTVLWIAYALVAASLLAAAITAMEWAAQLLRLPARFLWAAGLAAAVALPFVSVNSGPTSGAAHSTRAFVIPAVLISAGAEADALTARHARVQPTTVLTSALAVWAIWSLLALGRLGVGAYRLSRERVTWTGAVLDGVAVRVAPTTGPAAIGILSREVVIPRWVIDLPASDRVLVLAHERAHLAAHDPALRMGAAFVTALMPWNPAVRWMENRLLLAMERDCDARVLAAQVDRRAYARLLVHIAARGSAPSLMPALSQPPTHLERRIVAMHHRERTMPRLRAAGLALLSVATLSGALLLPEPTSEAMAAQQQAQAPPLGVDQLGDTTYFEFQVDTAVSPRAMTPPVYPAEQRAALVNGDVIVQFVVDSSGALDMGTVKVLSSTHEAFTEAVKTSLATATFNPAWRSGKAVRQLVQMPFAFRVSNPSPAEAG